jgi:hypothetical protein
MANFYWQILALFVKMMLSKPLQVGSMVKPTPEEKKQREIAK